MADDAKVLKNKNNQEYMWYFKKYVYLCNRLIYKYKYYGEIDIDNLWGHH